MLFNRSVNNLSTTNCSHAHTVPQAASDMLNACYIKHIPLAGLSTEMIWGSHFWSRVEEKPVQVNSAYLSYVSKNCLSETIILNVRDKQ